MKVIEINATYGYGSTGLIAKDIGELLKINDDEVRYVYQMGICDQQEGYRIGNPLDWKLHALYTRLFGKQAWGSRIATKKLLSYMDAEKPDIVHLHNLHANYINLPMLLKYLAKRKIATILTLHDCWFFTGKCCHFASIGCDRWKFECGSCPKRMESPKSILIDRSAFVVKEKAELFGEIKNLTVVGCSKWIAKLAEESFVFKNSKIVQIYNGIDTSVFTNQNRSICRDELSIHSEFVIMGMANKWLDDNNKEVFEKVISTLTDNEVIVLIGCTEKQKERISGYNNVRCIGYIKDRIELAKYYSASDVFVNLTFEDTLPTVNMEALACGTPVITYDSCGSSELIQEGITGYIIPQWDCSALLSALNKIKAGEINRNRCRTTVEKKFDKFVRYGDYISLFRATPKA